MPWLVLGLAYSRTGGRSELKRELLRRPLDLITKPTGATGGHSSRGCYEATLRHATGRNDQLRPDLLFRISTNGDELAFRGKNSVLAALQRRTHRELRRDSIHRKHRPEVTRRFLTG